MSARETVVAFFFKGDLPKHLEENEIFWTPRRACRRPPLGGGGGAGREGLRNVASGRRMRSRHGDQVNNAPHQLFMHVPRRESTQK